MSYPLYNDYPVAKKVESLYQGRIRQFNDKNGQYRDLNLPHFYDRTRIDHDGHIKLSVYDVPDLQRPSFADAMAAAEENWRPAHKGDWFGPSWSTHWFKIKVRIPSDWPEKYEERPIFDFDSSNEGFLYTEEGSPVIGLSGEHHRTEYIIPESWVKDSEWHTFYIETSCNDVTGVGSPPNPDRQFRLNRADLVVPHAPARALNIDFWLLGDCGREFPGNSWQKGRALDVLNQIINTFDRENPDESIKECRKLAATYFGNVDSEVVFRKKRDSIMQQNLVWAIGNCHIDTAWLWPYAETRRKIARSWSSQLDLLDRYPEYVFTASQAVQFQWLKEDHPDLFKRIQKAVKQGRFVPIGGSWVECDTNMPSGEALVRQMVLGQKFFEKEFGIRSKVFWLPDTFGYAPQLPQICRKAGQPYFMTQKLSWNNIDVFPLSTFSWVGLDGSQVVTHMPPNNTYTSAVNFGDVKRTIEQHKNLDTSQDGLMLFGYGDGGGGPTAEMLEKLRRCRGIANESELLPGSVSGSSYTPEAFFDNVVEKSNNGKSLPSWKGELYLEYHRGTYTTQAAIKRGNRKSEILMRDLELFATAASLKTRNYSYPYDEIHELWQLVLLNQFHDVLPGSGIEMIYEDARRIYAEIQKKASKLIKEALRALGYETLSDGRKDGMIINSIELSDEILNITREWCRELSLVNAEGYELPLNFGLLEKKTQGEVDALPKERINGDGVNVGEDVNFSFNSDKSANTEFGEEEDFDEEDEEEQQEEEEEEEEEEVVSDVVRKFNIINLEEKIVLKNDYLKATFVRGQLVSLYDLRQDREILLEGEIGNQLLLLEDQPMNFPAWDTEQYATEKVRHLKPIKWEKEGNFSLNTVYEFGSSKVHQSISIASGYLDVDTKVDWHETYQFLKVEFPVEIQSDFATYETSFGTQRRPTHFNTTWDAAKFEVNSHRFADLSQYDYGVSLVNDCKYGYSIHGKRMRLSLLRSPKSPDAHADMGSHTFRYAVYPHKGPLGPLTLQFAAVFNHPHYWVKHPHMMSGCRARIYPELYQIPHVVMLKDLPTVVVSSVKRADADKRSLKKRRAVVRLYETLGGRARGYLSCLLGVKSARKVNFLEDNAFEDDKEEAEAELDILTEEEVDQIPINMKPYEITTILIDFN